MQLKTLTLLAASLALAQAKVNGTWGDHSKAPVLATTTTPTVPTKPTGRPVDGGKTDVADETAPESSTWVDAEIPEPTKPVDGGKTDVADEVASSSTTWADASLPVDGGKTDVADEVASSTASYWGDASLPVDGGKTDVADEVASSTTWADASLPVDGGKTDVADEVASSTTAHWSDVTKVADLTTTEETTVEEVTKTITKGDGSKITTTEVNTKTITRTVYVTPTPVSGGQGQPPAGPPAKPVLGGEGAGCGVVTVTNTVVETITVPAGGFKPTGIPKPPPAAPTTPVVVTSEEPKTWQDVVPSAAPSSPPSAPVSGGYYGVVQTWRAKLGLKPLTLDSKLQSNAQDASDSTGGALKHKLNPGSMAQVMAPGDSGNFESVFVGGWLCELPNHPGLGSGVCNAASKGWNYAGQTGHAEILTSAKYSKIGCGLGDGIWTCDLA